VLTLTDHGRDLLAECAKLAHEYGREPTAVLSPAQRAGLDEALEILTARAGPP
jgi:DNA-binding MarR family transcriptional regulator